MRSCPGGPGPPSRGAPRAPVSSPPTALGGCGSHPASAGTRHLRHPQAPWVVRGPGYFKNRERSGSSCLGHAGSPAVPNPWAALPAPSHGHSQGDARPPDGHRVSWAPAAGPWAERCAYPLWAAALPRAGAEQGLVRHPSLWGALPLRKEWRFHWKSTSEQTDRSGLYAGTFPPGTFRI